MKTIQIAIKIDEDNIKTGWKFNGFEDNIEKIIITAGILENLKREVLDKLDNPKRFNVSS